MLITFEIHMSIKVAYVQHEHLPNWGLLGCDAIKISNLTALTEFCGWNPAVLYCLPWFLSWVRWIQSTPCHHIHVRSILILSFYLSLGLPRLSFPFRFSDQTFHAFLISPMCATCPINHMVAHMQQGCWLVFNPMHLLLLVVKFVSKTNFRKLLTWLKFVFSCRI